MDLERYIRQLHKFAEMARQTSTPPGMMSRDADVSTERTEFAAQQLRRKLNTAERFSFGSVDYNLISEAADCATDFYKAGLLNLPFDDCVFEVRVQNMFQNSDKDSKDIKVLMVCERALEGQTVRNNRGGTTFVTNRIQFIMQLTTRRASIGGPVVCLLEDCANDEYGALATLSDEGDCSSYINLFKALWMILNTKNVKVRKEEPGAALQKARLKRGEPPLKPVTYVDVGQYIRARQEADAMREKGTHASPRPHLRRGHIRVQNGKPTAVRPHIVNAHLGEPIKREEYRVKHAA